MTRCLALTGWYIWWVIGMPSCKEYRETWERTEWGGNRRNGERALQKCSYEQSIERNWTFMALMSFSEILCLCCRVLFYLCLKGYATGWGHGIWEAAILTITDKEYRLKFLCNVNTLFVSCCFKNAVKPTGISRGTKIAARLWCKALWLPKHRLTFTHHALLLHWVRLYRSLLI